MSSSLVKKVLVFAVCLPLVAWMLVATQSSTGQERAAGQKKEAKAPKGRLPAYYADVVTAKQREEIYSIQSSYATQLKDLNQQIADLLKKQREEIEALLSPEQRAQLEKISADAIQKKKKKAADKKAAEATVGAPATSN
jgi:Spy/CpxP family protein refolding chaperone